MLPFSGLMLPRGRLLAYSLTLGAVYEGIQAGSTAGVILTFKTDGTWEITFDPADVGSGTPLTGTWLVSGGTASEYEIRYTPSNQVNTPTIVNDAATYTALSANRLISVKKTSADAEADVLVEVRFALDTTINVSATSNLRARGA